MLKGLYILNTDAYHLIYGEDERNDIMEHVDIYAPLQTPESVAANHAILNDADVIFSGWHMPLMTKQFLDAAPNLKVVFYGAGSVKGFLSEEVWRRDIIITSAYAANAVPVAEFTVAQIICCLKRVWYYVNKIRQERTYVPLKVDVPGAYKTTVGIISLGMIGRLVCMLLKQFSMNVIAYDPYAGPEVADELNVQLCSLDDIFKHSDVVSLHAPWLPETEGLITGEHLAMMKPGSSFINTARGAIVCENEMIEVLKSRPDITAVLDVTFPEPPERSSSLYTLNNVILTPHLAGSSCNECRRMGRYMVEELHRYIENQPLQWAISQEKSLLLGKI